MYSPEVAQLRITQSKLRYKKRNKVKNRAMVYAERYTTLKDKCEWCGSTENLSRHHSDYSKPVQVLTLCAKCNKEADRQRRKQLRTGKIDTDRHCDNCGKTFSECGKKHPSFRGRPCSNWIQKI